MLRRSEGGARGSGLAGVPFLPSGQRVRRRLQRAGLSLSLRTFIVCTALLIIVSTSALWQGGRLLPFPVAMMTGILIGVGLPQIICALRIKRRQGTFLSQFPEAIDLILRGLKAGLPVSASIGTMAKEIPEPVGPEFRRMVDEMAVGAPLEQVLTTASERVGVREFRFFAVSLSVQQETGGDLSETLGNLADILRKRRQLKLKVRALASEARASAAIIGVLPFVMFGMISLINPEYASALVDDERGRMLAIGGVVWLGIGFTVMRQMVKLEA
jgi:tight adherence protein B